MSLSVLIVGCGNIAGGYDVGDGPVRTHAGAYRRHGGFALTACVDPDRERREAFASRWGVTRHYADLLDVEDRRFDLVSLCSPSELHADHLRTLLTWPIKAVFCEKPITLDLNEARSLVADYERAGILLAVNYLRRWDREVQAVAAEDWGRLLTARGIYTKGILTNGSHLIDLAQALLGPLRAESVTDRVEDFAPYDPTLGAVLRNAEGAPVILSVGDRNFYTIFELDLLFEKGRVTFGDAGFTLCRRRIVDDPRFAGYRILEPPDWRSTGLDEALPDAVANLHAAIRSRAPLRSDGRSALATQELCIRLIEMAERKEPSR